MFLECSGLTEGGFQAHSACAAVTSAPGKSKWVALATEALSAVVRSKNNGYISKEDTHFTIGRAIHKQPNSTVSTVLLLLLLLCLTMSMPCVLRDTAVYHHQHEDVLTSFMFPL
jgi:hypothetical protein